MRLAIPIVGLAVLLAVAGLGAWWFLLRDDDGAGAAPSYVPLVARDEGLPDATATPPGPTPAPGATPSPTPACAAEARIKAWERDGNPESLTVEGSGDMTGWSVISSPGDQRFNFPDGFALDGTVVLYSGVSAFDPTRTTLWWAAVEVWDDSGFEAAYLYDCNGVLVDSKLGSP